MKNSIRSGLVGMLAAAFIPGCVAMIPVRPAPQAESYQKLERNADAAGNLPAGRENVDGRYAGRVVELTEDNLKDFVDKGNRVVLLYNENRESKIELYSFSRVAQNSPNINFGQISQQNHRKTFSNPPFILFFKDGKGVGATKNYFLFSAEKRFEETMNLINKYYPAQR